MRWAARLDPRLDPTLTPEQWGAARRRYLVQLAVLLLFAVGLLGAGGYRYATTRDRSRGMEPEQVVEAAGLSLAKVRSYRFVAQLRGDAPDGFFPNAVMKGAYRRDPLLLHLAGDAGSGELKLPLEYYLEEATLYVKNPRSNSWMLVENPDLEELDAFQPDNLAAPLVGVRSAAVVGRERLAGGEALVLSLDLDPAVMRIPPPGDDECVDYRLWVYTRTLMPARFIIGVTRLAEQGTSFQYEIDWDYRQPAPSGVPAEVKEQAQKG